MLDRQIQSRTRKVDVNRLVRVGIDQIQFIRFSHLLAELVEFEPNVFRISGKNQTFPCWIFNAG
ncbi:MAG: hypothetical protein KKG33_02040 [candidate division Zixibacteria bacterium]|nr:hypothetical protein [candidate division Zixibacteria bacterium]MBU1470620.1 hypothetical protein [candidate division Zixibacteria bacterium]MBU2624321.1 hypothetical protein [candidate division Zixibacteria bacterium]